MEMSLGEGILGAILCFGSIFGGLWLFFWVDAKLHPPKPGVDYRSEQQKKLDEERDEYLRSEHPGGYGQ